MKILARSALALMVLSAAVVTLVTPSGANGTESLGPPSGVTLAAGSGIATGGVGMFQQPAQLRVDVPPGATVKQALLYWEGQWKRKADPTIVVDGTSVTGAAVGGPTALFKHNGQQVRSTAFRADITSLGKVAPGSSSLTLSGLTFDHANNGAGILVIYDTGAPAAITLRDGNDYAYHAAAGALRTTAPQTFAFPAATFPRVAQLGLMVSSIAEQRPHAIRITVQGQAPLELVSPLGDTDGKEWDSDTLAVAIPPGANALTVQLLSKSDGSARNPASLSWINATLAVQTCPNAPAVRATSSGSAYGVDLDLLGQPVLDEQGKVASAAPGGPTAKSDQLLAVPAAPVLDAGILLTSSSSETTPASTTTATATVLDLNLLGGAITASKVHGVSQSVATTGSATYGSTGSHFTDLVINGTPITSVAPNTTVAVKAPGNPHQTIASAHLYEEAGASSIASGAAKASHSVNMIRVVLLKPFGPLAAGAELVVSHAESKAQSPAPPCPTTAAVGGHAFAAFAERRLGSPVTPVATVKVGEAPLPVTGGSHRNPVAAVTVHGAVAAGAATDTTSGSLTPNPNATSRSTVTGVNALGGQIRARLLDVSSASEAGTAATGTTFDATFVDLVVGGNPIAGTPEPNTTIAIPQPDGSLLLVVLNEQLRSTNGTVESQGTVNAIHAYLFRATGALQGELIIASAHSLARA